MDAGDGEFLNITTHKTYYRTVVRRYQYLIAGIVYGNGIPTNLAIDEEKSAARIWAFAG
jgi:hypothetical protein